MIPSTTQPVSWKHDIIFPRFERHCYKACPEKTFSTQWECRACGTNCGNCDQHECYWCEEGFFLSGKLDNGDPGKKRLWGPSRPWLQ